MKTAHHSDLEKHASTCKDKANLVNVDKKQLTVLSYGLYFTVYN
jgi:hypothetical protein